MSIKLKMPKIKISFPAPVKEFFGKIGTFFYVLYKKAATFSSIIKVVIVSICVLLALAITFFGVLVYGYKTTDKATKFVANIVPYPIAIVNYNFITYKDYLQERDYIHHFYDATKQTSVDLKEIDKQILTQLIENKIIEFEALRYKVSVDKGDIDNSIQTIIDQNGGKDNVEKVLTDLYGLSLNQFERLVKIQLLRDKLDQKVIARVEARHILIRVDQDAPDDKVAEAKTKIDGILTEIKGGADFAESAKKNSEDVGSAEQGGKLDAFAKGEMVDEFSKMAFSTPVGQVSEPFRTEFGWHILKVESRQGSIEMKFTDWLDSIKNKSLIFKFYEV